MYRRLSILFALFIAICQFISAETTVASLEEQTETTTQNNLNDYRRSSLCIILVTHQGTKYAENMERQFLKMQLPERYNEHNIQLRVLHTNKSLKSKNIAKLLENNEVGKQLVAKWFNRDPHTGQMNMDLIHERGGYNASMSDAERADMTVRGRAILQEEGVDLIQNTFVLVCDMQYKKRNDAGALASLGTFLLSAGMQAMGQYTHTDVSASTRQLNQAAGELADLSGFSVLMDAHLLQLKWTKEDLSKLYSNYWVDETTPAFEAEAHKRAFDNDAKAFRLEYLGHYKSKSTKLQMEHSEGFDDLILAVTDKTVNKSIKQLSLMFPQFKPRTPLVHKYNTMMAYVGTKENITNKTKFDVVESVKKNGTIKYNTVGKLNVVAGSVWNNSNIRLDEISNLESIDGTHLYSKKRKNYASQPYLLVESGKSRLGNMKKFTFDVGIKLGMLKYPNSKVEEKIAESCHSGTVVSSTPSIGGFSISPINVGISWNISKVFSWNLMEFNVGVGSDCVDLGFSTGLTTRFATMGKKKRASLYLQPTVGWGLLCPPNYVEFTSSRINSKQVKYQEREWNRWTQSYRVVTKYRTEHYTSYSTGSAYLDNMSYLNWSIRLGVNITKFYLAVGYGANQNIAAQLGYRF